MRIALSLTGLFVAIAAIGQGSGLLAERHQRISALHKAEDHRGTVKEIELQLKEAIGTPWQDSIYRYTYTLGRAVWKSESADAGVAAAERVLALVKGMDKNVLHRLDAMDDLSRLLNDMGRVLDCVRVDSTTLAIADAHASVPLLRRGEARQAIAYDLASLGDHANALKYYLDARSIYKRIGSVPALNMSEAYNGAGSSCWHLGRTREAESYYQQALAYLDSCNDKRKPFRKAGILGNMGILWQDAGDLARSKAHYTASISVCGAVADTATDVVMRTDAIMARTRGYVNLATVYFSLGENDRTRQLLELALKDRQELLEPDDPRLLGVYYRLAQLEMEDGRSKQAEVHMRRYAEACEKYYGVRSEDHLRALAQLAEVNVELGADAVADSLFDRSVALHKAMDESGTDPELAIALRQRAAFRLDQHRTNEAIADLQEARSISVRVHGEAHYRSAMYDLLLAEAYLDADDPRGAHRFATRALATVQVRADAVNLSPVPQAFAQPHLLPDAIYYKVLAERTMDSTVSSGQQVEQMDLAVMAMARNKASYDDEASKLGFIGQQNAVFDLAVDVAYDDWREHGTTARLDHFLNITEADRSILLKSRLNDFSGIRFAGVPDSIITREGQLIAALDIEPEERAATKDLDKREKELADFLTRLSKEYPDYFNLRYGEPHVSVADLRKQLVSPEQSLLAYAITAEHVYMLVVRADTAALVQAPNKGLAEVVKALNAAVTSRDAAAYTSTAHQLHQVAFAPVAHLLTTQRLLIIPDGALHTVNFEALLDAPCTATDFRNHLLLQRYAIAYLLSATTAVQFADLTHERTKGVLAIAPGFTDDLKQDYLSRVQDSTLVDRQFLGLVRQPFAMSTAEGLGGSLSARVMVGGDASEKGFRSAANEYGILHLGTHAEMNAASPMYSRLVLSKDGQGADADADGYLHAYEIYELDLRAQLAVLTACETGIGKDVDGEGVRSLGYSFAYAGCPSLVMSLWSIDEKVSSEIITRFYKYLADGMPKHEALRQAKLDHLTTASDELALPYYWAGMVLVGDVSPVEVGVTRWWWLFGAGAFILGAVVLWRLRRR
ncbi:MAG: CHAT domain-containing protein [Flavobacteriales bacterium]|nr:MAG: CHAT domain-containing protein [Flavobacteriales bacterium]